MDEADILKGIQAPGRFDAVVGSQEEAFRLVRTALPHAQELPPAQSGLPYSSPPPRVKTWYQLHPAEPKVGNDLPHVKYADWSKGKKGKGGS